MKKIGYVFVLMLVLMGSFVLADISLSEPEEIYSLGDKLYINAEGLRGAEIGNLNVNLVCGNKTVNLVRWPASDFSVEEDQAYATSKVLVRGDLEIVNLTEILGECQVVLSLGGQMALTKLFTISDDVFVSASTDKTNYNPGEGILVSIDVIKANGGLLNGFVDATGAASFSKVVEGGFVGETFSMHDTAEAGLYSVGLRVYDVDKDGVLNEGFANISFNINQVASSMVLSLSDAEVVPGENFTIGVEVFDQSGKEIVGTVSVKVASPDSEEIEVMIPAGDFSTFDFPVNATAGLWSVIAIFEGIGEEREFEMVKSSVMEFDINEGVLEVICVGNWECNGSVDVQIGEENMDLDLMMEVGDVRRFSLKAPQGEYEVVVSDGESSISRNVLLTGNAISVSDFKDAGVFRMYSIIWVLLIVVLGAVGVILFRGSRKTKMFKGGDSVKSKVVSPSLNSNIKFQKLQGLDVKSQGHKDKAMVDLTRGEAGSAESALVLKGEKYPSVIVVLSVKNYASLGSNAKDILIKTVEETKELKGLVDWRENYAFIVFSPLTTKTYKNEVLASKTGFRILRRLNDYNKKFKDKVEFNIGVHTGELISSKIGSKLQYTGLGNTISLAKRISDSDKGKLLVSEDVRKKMFRDLRATKAKVVGKSQTYEVSGILDREVNTAKLKNLLKRIE